MSAPDSAITISLLGCDPIHFERIRASLARSPFRFSAEDPDLLVMPAQEVGRLGPECPPVIAWGPAALMRSAFLAGCADYLRDPWTPEELALRAEAVLARQARAEIFPWGRLQVKNSTLITPRGDAPLTQQETRILRALLRRRGHVVPRAALAAVLGSRTRANHSRRIDVHVSAIRRRVRALLPEAGSFIRCVRGEGYIVDEPVAPAAGTTVRRAAHS